jgi:4-hydroxy-tetrahydrodipicolinate synthase
MSDSSDLIFRGLYTAIVTPFQNDADRSIDKEAYRRHLEFQIKGEVDGLVVCGTTGESPTFSDEEFRYLIETAVEVSDGRVQIIAGSGSNSTSKSIKRSKIAAEAGADGLLIVTPYYNKPTQEGLIRHFTTIADATDVPVMVYNVPGRTATNIQPSTLAHMAEHPNIAAVKEASGDMNQILEVLASVPQDFAVLSGDDALTLPLISAGGDGVVSVASNLVPIHMSAYVDHCLEDRMEHARESHYQLLPLMKANFWESNPIPVKSALAMMGRMEDVFRLPLVPMSEAYREPFRAILSDLQWEKAYGEL